MNQAQNSRMLADAVARQRAGDLDGAAHLCGELLASEPGNAQALAMLGMIRLQRGMLQEGIALLRASLQQQPQQPDMLNNLGRALHMTGDCAAALEPLEQALLLVPDYLGALFNQGNVLYDLKRYAAAAASFERVVALQPGHLDARLNLGIALKDLGRTQEALAQFERVAQAAPYRADVHCNRGLLLLEMRRYAESLASFEKAVRLAPQLTEALNGAGMVLRKLGRHAEGLQCYDQVLKFSPSDRQAHCQRGLALEELGRHEEALKSYSAAIQHDKTCVQAYVLRAELHMEQGRMAEAEQDLEAALAIDPEYPSIYGPLMSLKKYSAHDPQFRQMEALYAKRQALRQDEVMELAFAMGRALEKQGRHDDAFAAYAEGNRLHQLHWPFAEQGDEELSNWIMSTFDRAFFENHERAAAALPADTERRTPIFIVGMPRSGSTLVEQILASHAEVFGAGELQALPQTVLANPLIRHDATDGTVALANFRRMGQAYLDEVWKLAPEARYITDKLPVNFRYLGLAHLMLPHAKFIHVVRDPMDTCFSCYSLLFSGDLDFTYDLGVLGRYYRRYVDLMRHWRSVLPAGRILEVRYEDAVADIETQARRMLEHLGLPWDPACLKFYETERPVGTASVTQVRQPIYSGSIARWKKFETHLAPLLEIVSQTASPG